MNQTIEKFLASLNALHQLEPKNLPDDVLHVMIKMSPEGFLKTVVSQLAVLRHNIPGKEQTITLQEEEIARLAEGYLKELLKRFKH